MDTTQEIILEGYEWRLRCKREGSAHLTESRMVDRSVSIIIYDGFEDWGLSGVWL